VSEAKEEFWIDEGRKEGRKDIHALATRSTNIEVGRPMKKKEEKIFF
jgi:hypothetical protein